MAEWEEEVKVERVKYAAVAVCAPCFALLCFKLSSSMRKGGGGETKKRRLRYN